MTSGATESPRIDTSTNAIVLSTPVGTGPNGVAVRP